MAKKVMFDKSLIAVDPDNNLAPLEVDANGNLKTTASITGDVTVDNVTIANDTGNPVPVSGPLTDTQLRAADVPVTLDSEAVVLGAGTSAIGKLTTLPGLDIPAHDYIGMTYTDNDLTGVVYKTGGSSGTTVATLTLAYDAGNLVSVTKS